MISRSRRLDIVFVAILSLMLIFGTGIWVGRSFTGNTNTFALGSFETAALNVTGDWYRGATNLTARLLGTWGALISTSLDTGHGANELYDMNQNVLTTSSPTFDDLTVSDQLDASVLNFTSEFYWNDANRTALVSGQNATASTAYVGFDSNREYLPNYWLCDEITDEVQINAAIVYVNGLGGGTVYLERGTYNLTDSVDKSSYSAGWTAAINIVYNNIRLTGDKDALVQFTPGITGPANGMVLVWAEGDNIDVLDLQFNGNDANIVSAPSDVNAVFINSCDWITIKGNYFEDTSGGTVWGDHNTDNYGAIITDNQFDLGWGGNGVALHNGPIQSVISDNVIRNPGDGIFIDTCTEVIVSGNIIERANSKGINVYDDNHDILVSNNLITGKAGGAPSWGIHVHDKAEPEPQSTNVRLLDNTVVDRDYGIYLESGSDHEAFGNRLDSITTTIFQDDATDTRLATISLSFVEGTTLLTTAPFGWEIDANTEYALALGALPLEVQQVVRWKIWATSVVTNSSAMKLEIEGYGGASDEAYTTETVSVTNHSSTTTNFTANDVIYWTLTSSDDADLDDFLGGDVIMIKILHEAAAALCSETDAIFLCVEIKYV